MSRFYAEQAVGSDAGASTARFPRWSMGTIGNSALACYRRAGKAAQPLIVPALQRGNACWDALRPGLAVVRLLVRTPERPRRGSHAEHGNHRKLRACLLPPSWQGGTIPDRSRAPAWECLLGRSASRFSRYAGR
ncbi:hypothetical protein [Pseudomonas sp. FME51]|uniref:hypothetical protein n=1 Tax=Pseudomonas sp. FME51 TaxID=2742609 RepID=UPI0018680FAA|nr:hypothetical protein [Pseudomonas sp. FME51]